MAVLTLNQARRKLDRKADQAMRGLALELTGRIVRRTPVDTGRARGNWHADIGRPRRTVTDAVDPSGGGTIAAASAATAQLAVGRSWFLTNGLPYIRRLEDGWSLQAPSGMVKVTIAELRQLARDIGAKLIRQ